MSGGVPDCHWNPTLLDDHVSRAGMDDLAVELEGDLPLEDQLILVLERVRMSGGHHRAGFARDLEERHVAPSLRARQEVSDANRVFEYRVLVTARNVHWQSA